MGEISRCELCGLEAARLTTVDEARVALDYVVYETGRRHSASIINELPDAEIRRRVVHVQKGLICNVRAAEAEQKALGRIPIPHYEAIEKALSAFKLPHAIVANLPGRALEVQKNSRLVKVIPDRVVWVDATVNSVFSELGRRGIDPDHDKFQEYVKVQLLRICRGASSELVDAAEVLLALGSDLVLVQGELEELCKSDT